MTTDHQLSALRQERTAIDNKLDRHFYTMANDIRAAQETRS